jgi:hypothetical protein
LTIDGVYRTSAYGKLPFCSPFLNSQLKNIASSIKGVSGKRLEPGFEPLFANTDALVYLQLERATIRFSEHHSLHCLIPRAGNSRVTYVFSIIAHPNAILTMGRSQIPAATTGLFEHLRPIAFWSTVSDPHGYVCPLHKQAQRTSLKHEDEYEEIKWDGSLLYNFVNYNSTLEITSSSFDALLSRGSHY